MSDLGFTVRARVNRGDIATFIVERDSAMIATARYAIGNVKRRRETATAWVSDPRLQNGTTIEIAAVERELDAAEIRALQAADAQREYEAATIEEAQAAAIAGDGLGGGGQKERGPSQATQLVDLVKALVGLELWHDPDGNGFATIPVGEHHENWPIRSKRFRQWASRLFYEANEKVPGGQALQDAVTTIEGQAVHCGREYPVHVRLAEHDGDIYLDLADVNWRVVRITSGGWEIISNSPIKFRRTRGMQAHPIPLRGGNLADLRRFLNAPDDNTFILIVAWIVGAYKPRGPYAILEVNGEQGSAKSTTCKHARRLVDPNKADLRSPPREERDLNVAAVNSWVVGLGNMSHIPAWLSDALCRVSVDGGFATRELYSDTDETILDDRRPLILNGINEVITRSDALDRVVRVCLPQIADTARRSEEELVSEFEAERPALLGGLLDAVSTALRNKESVKMNRLPRMADFAQWIIAAEPALPWEPGMFMRAYMGNREFAHELALEASPVAAVLRSWFESREGVTWSGTATELHQALSETASDKVREGDDWPKSGRGLSGILRRLAPNLRHVGVDVQFSRAGRGGEKRRIVTIRTIGENPVPTVPTDPDGPGSPRNVDSGGGSGNEGNANTRSQPSREAGFFDHGNGGWNEGNDGDDSMQDSLLSQTLAPPTTARH